MVAAQLHASETLARRYDPALLVVEAFGGYNALSKLLGIEASTVFRWCQSREVNGTGGFIPRKHWNRLLQLADSRSIELTRELLMEPPAQRVEPVTSSNNAA